MGSVGKLARLLVLAVRYRQGLSVAQRRARLRAIPTRGQDCVPMALAFITGGSPEGFPLPAGASSLVEWAHDYSERLEESDMGLAVTVIPGWPRCKGEWIGIVPMQCHAVVMKGDRCIFDPSEGAREGSSPDIYGQLHVNLTSP